MTPLPPEELASLLKRARAGDRDAQGRLVLQFERLVYKTAYRYLKRSRDNDLDDLAQAGREGLLHAIQLWDPVKAGDRATFLTYGGLWVRVHVQHAVLRSFPVKHGWQTDERNLVFSLTAREGAWHQKHGVPLPDDELAAQLKIPVERAAYVRTKVQNLRTVPSLDAPTQGGDRLGDVLSSAPEPPSQDNTLDVQRVLRHFKCKTGREDYILRHRILAEDAVSLERIGRRFRTSRARVGQIEAELRRRLRAFLRDKLNRGQEQWLQQGEK